MRAFSKSKGVISKVTLAPGTISSFRSNMLLAGWAMTVLPFGRAVS